MNFIVVQQFGAVLTVFLGVLAVLSPGTVEKFVSVQAVGKLGVSEIRATYGGFFLGLSLFALYTQELNAFLALGFGWLGAAIVRGCTVLFGAFSAKNVGGVVFELVIALMCLSSLITLQS